MLLIVYCATNNHLVINLLYVISKRCRVRDVGWVQLGVGGRVGVGGCEGSSLVITHPGCVCMCVYI